MDLLGDLGMTDQLTAARAENAILSQKVKDLTARVKVLTVEKATLEAEVEMYRQQAAADGIVTSTNNNTREQQQGTTSSISPHRLPSFFQSGNGQYCQTPQKNNNNACSNNNNEFLSLSTNPLCVSLSPNERHIWIGGADGHLYLMSGGWEGGGEAVVGSVDCSAPVICVSDVQPQTSSVLLLAVGGMDGSVKLIEYDNRSQTMKLVLANNTILKKHSKFCKSVELIKRTDNQNTSVLATACGNGDIHLYEIVKDLWKDDDEAYAVTPLHSYHWKQSIESLVFANDQLLLAYVRDTPHITAMHLVRDGKDDGDNDKEETGVEFWNVNNDSSGNAGFEHHVSFSILDMKLSPNGKFLACATDNHRHVIWELEHGGSSAAAAAVRIVQNLYGHQADHYSTPKVAWSCNNQYLYSNTQHEGKLLVYEIASGKIVREIEDGSHDRPIKDLYASSSSDVLVTTSFDRKTIVWINNQQP